MVVRDGRAAVTHEPAPALVLVPPGEAPDGDRWFLGVDGDGVAYFGASGPLPLRDGAQPAGLRRVGALLGDRTPACSCTPSRWSNWHASTPVLPALRHRDAAGGRRARPPSARATAAEHFPRVPTRR